jgi:hypothetical protein
MDTEKTEQDNKPAVDKMTDAVADAAALRFSVPRIGLRDRIIERALPAPAANGASPSCRTRF